ncbi:hypothetical protein Tco_1557332, partial [Tanacetum coccineum]
EGMVKNLDNVGNFLMYPRVGKGFSGRETPLFPTMVVHNQEEMDEDKAVYKELDDSLVRAATTASSLEAEDDNGNLTKTRSKATLNEPSSLGTSSEVIHFEVTTKTTQANEIASLKRRVKKLEKKDRSRTYKLKRLYKVGLSARVESYRDEKDLGEDASKQGRIDDIDTDAGITLRNVVEEVVADIDATSSAATITDVEITLAQALSVLKSAKPKADKVVIQEPEQEPMVEQVKPMKRLEQMRLDEELAFKLQAEAEEEEEEEERLAR